MSGAFHGGAFWEAVGPDFGRLDKLDQVISADVLDAWFPPCPGAMEVLQTMAGAICRTSPPADGEGLVRAIATARSLNESQIVLGAGSSSLIFTAFREWFGSGSTALILEPTYGEYAHVLEAVIGARVERWAVPMDEPPCLDRLIRRLSVSPPALLVLINPNNPTGRYFTPEGILSIVRSVPSHTVIWVDEAYLEYVPSAVSMEAWVEHYPNLVICKSLSKVYALSGLRVAYLACSPDRAEGISRITPPWAVSLPAQIAAVRALADNSYYQARYTETALRRRGLAQDLARLDLGKVIETDLNFVLLRPDRMSAESLVSSAAHEGVYLRDLSSMGAPGWVRIAVKDPSGCEQIVRTLQAMLAPCP
jgi:histidinol-phosphate/aromatic aminotransferase/cobyric acid decarboxylase-like protein